MSRSAKWDVLSRQFGVIVVEYRQADEKHEERCDGNDMPAHNKFEHDLPSCFQIIESFSEVTGARPP